MSAREYHHLTKEQKQDVRAAFAKLPSSMTYTEKIKEAFAVAKVVVRKPDENGKYYPSFFPWLRSSTPTRTRTRTLPPTQKSTSKSKSKSKSEEAIALALTPAMQKLVGSVRGLGDALVQFVLAEVAVSMDSALPAAFTVTPAPRGTANVSPLKSPDSRGSAAKPVSPTANPEPRTENSLHSLTDQQLKDRLGVAKAAKNLSLAAKITNVLRMRDRSATVIANSAEVES